MKRIAILALVIGVLALAPAAHAATITLTQAQLLGFVGVGGVNVTSQNPVLDLGTGIQLEATFEIPILPGQYADFTLTGLNIANVNGDTFMLNYVNSNSNDWKWTVFLIGGGSGSDWTDVGPNVGDLLTINLDGTPITGVRIRAEGYFPAQPEIGAQLDRVANSTFVSAVPDPGSSLLLMGLGLVGLRMWKKR